MGWEGIASGGDIFALDRFGESGPAEQVAEHLGLTADKIAAAIRSKK
jgi:transketolase